jgi:transposase-like protein
MDEVYIVTARGRRLYLWRALDQGGDVLDILVQKRKNKGASVQFFRKLLKIIEVKFLKEYLLIIRLQFWPATSRLSNFTP